MKKEHFLLVFFGFLTKLLCQSFATEPNFVTKQFKSSEELFANPERGWLSQQYSNDT